MDRRGFLSAGVAVALTGCTGSIPGISDGGSPGSSGFDLPSSVQVDDPLSEITFGQMMTKEYLRYYDPDSDSLKKAYPTRSQWIEATVNTKNLGDEEIAAVGEDEVSMFGGGEEVPALLAPHDIDWSQVRLREENKMYWVEPGYIGPERVGAGNEVVAYFLFDMNGATYPGVKIDSDRFGTHKLHPQEVLRGE